MNRRRALSVIGTTGVGGGAIWLAYQVDQGAIDIDDDTAVSETVSVSSESFTFDTTAGAEMFITIRRTTEGSSRGSFGLHAPDGTQVIGTRLSMTTETTETHTAAQDGTYRLSVSPGDERLRVSVTLQETE